MIATLAASLPAITPVTPPGTDGFQTVLGWVFWGAILVVVIGFIAVGVTMALGFQRGDGAQNIGKLGWVAVGAIIVGAATGFASTLLGADISSVIT